jgi:CheY-like chemotaxis protein
MPHLLIVDDEPGAAAAMAALLRRHGHEVSCAASVTEALRQLRAQRPDLMLLDLGLPRVDGLDFLHALAGEPGLSDIPIAVYSGRDEPGAIETARRLGACEYILKGDDWEQTYRRIESCLPTRPDADA